MIETKLVQLVSSSVLDYENNLNPFPIKQQMMSRYLQMATLYQELNEAVRQRAEQLEQQGVKAVDALHVACAEAASSDYFLTCDKRLINRYQEKVVRVLNPVDFILEVEDNDTSQE